jgi:hypothetical protein
MLLLLLMAKLPAAQARLKSTTKLFLSVGDQWGVIALVKITVSFYQLVLICMEMYGIPLTSACQSILSVFSVFNFDIFELLRVDCMHKFSFYQTSAAFITTIIMVEVVAFVCAGCQQRENYFYYFASAWEGTLIATVYFFYSPVCAQALKTFVCTQIDGEEYLSADLERNCSASGHSSAVAFAVFALIMVALGFPFFCLYSLHTREHRLQATGRTNLEFFVRDYLFEMRYWEFIDIAKRGLLIGIGALLPRGSVVQIALAICTVCAYIVLLVRYRPYRQHQTFAMTASILLLGTLYLGLLLTIKTEMDKGSGIRQTGAGMETATGLFKGFSVKFVEFMLVLCASIVFFVFIVKVARCAQHVVRTWRSLRDLNQKLDQKSIVLFDSEFDDYLVDYADITMSRVIGQGAAGVVSRGRWKGKDIAVKVQSLSIDALSSYTSSSQVEDQIDEVKNEARILSRIRHQNIVHFYGVAFKHTSIDLQLLILLELCTHSLKDEIDNAAKTKSLTWRLKLRYLLDIAQGMQCLHEQNILHRDLVGRV